MHASSVLVAGAMLLGNAMAAPAVASSAFSLYTISDNSAFNNDQGEHDETLIVSASSKITNIRTVSPYHVAAGQNNLIASATAAPFVGFYTSAPGRIFIKDGDSRASVNLTETPSTLVTGFFDVGVDVGQYTKGFSLGPPNRSVQHTGAKPNDFYSFVACTIQSDIYNPIGGVATQIFWRKSGSATPTGSCADVMLLAPY